MSKKAEKAPAELPPDALTLARHPRAHAQIVKWRVWAGLIGFVAMTWLSVRAGVPAFDAWARGLGAGVVCFVGVWLISIWLWKYLVMAEIEAARRRLVGPPEQPEP